MGWGRPMSEWHQLSGAVLDCWVALAEGHVAPQVVGNGPHAVCQSMRLDYDYPLDFNPSADWSLAEPILQREHIRLRDMLLHQEPMFEAMMTYRGATWFAEGDLPLVAAMRVYVRTRFTDAQLAAPRFP